MTDWHKATPRDYQTDPDRHTPVDPHGTPLTRAELEARGWKVWDTGDPACAAYFGLTR